MRGPKYKKILRKFKLNLLISPFARHQHYCSPVGVPSEKGNILKTISHKHVCLCVWACVCAHKCGLAGRASDGNEDNKKKRQCVRETECACERERVRVHGHTRLQNACACVTNGMTVVPVDPRRKRNICLEGCKYWYLKKSNAFRLSIRYDLSVRHFSSAESTVCE